MTAEQEPKYLKQAPELVQAIQLHAMTEARELVITAHDTLIEAETMMRCNELLGIAQMIKKPRAELDLMQNTLQQVHETLTERLQQIKSDKASQ